MVLGSLAKMSANRQAFDSEFRLNWPLDDEMQQAMKHISFSMRAHLIWYVPLATAVIFFFVIPDLLSGYESMALIVQRFSLILLISPSAYLFLGCVLASTFLPLRLLLMIPPLFDRGAQDYGERYKLSFVIVIVVVVACFILQSIRWGSFPVPADPDGTTHIRMIPFLPWPEFPLPA